MKTEARRAYEKQAPKWEKVLRDRLKHEKRILAMWKNELRQNRKILRFEKEAGISEERERLFNNNISWIRDVINAQKHLVQVLKDGLPQRRPAGVMAKCPFCGATQKDVVTKVMFEGTVEVVPALDAHCNDVFKAVTAECLNCGHRIDKWHTEDVQKVIDIWNRRK